jgi:predicted RNA binding protein YcfA (HicA-like mRNA interferase family)
LKVPRDVSGTELCKMLGRYGYEATRQSGSHIRLTSNVDGAEHHVTIPAHKTLKLGTLVSILDEVAIAVKLSRSDLERELFEE